MANTHDKDNQALFGSIREAIDTIKDDIGEVKEEARTTLMEASMVRALLVESEKAVKRDINRVRHKLEEMLTLLEKEAIASLRATVTKTKEEVAIEMATLESKYHSLEDFEADINSTVSNLSVKPLETGMDLITSLKTMAQNTRASMYTKNLAFIINPVLADILDDVDECTLGDIVLVPRSDPILNKTVPDEEEVDYSRTSSRCDTCARTSFSRSSSHSSVKTPQPDTAFKALMSHAKDEHVRQRTSTPMDKGVVQKNALHDNDSVKELPLNTLHDDDNGSVKDLKHTFNKRSNTAPCVISYPGGNSHSTEHESSVSSNSITGPRMEYVKAVQTSTHDKSCYITGITCLRNGSVVVCDNAHDDVQLFNSSYRVVSHLECLNPWGVTAVSDSAVAVTLHYDRKIMFIKIDDGTLVHIFDKDVAISCKETLLYDVIFRQYRLYVLCSHSEIHVLDMKGKEFSVIRTVIPQNTLKFLDVDTERKRLYISGDKVVVCVNFEGRLLWKYASKPATMFVPMGLRLNNSCIYVNDWRNYKVVELSLSGKYNRDAVAAQLERPVAMGVSSNGETMLISQGDTEMDKLKSRSIKVFSIEL